MRRSLQVGMVVCALGVSVSAVVLGVAAAREKPVRVAAGDHLLRMCMSGEGSPAVILETFGVAPLETWNRIQPRIAEFARVVAYDHAGYWGSMPGPKPRDAKQIARELRTALRNAAVEPPYLLVGYSFGGPYVRVFAGMYPDEVAGMVLVDPTQEAFMEMLKERFPELNVVTAEDRRREDEWGSQWLSMSQAREAVLPRVPITLISGAAADDVLTRNLLPLWLEEHARWLNRFPHAQHLVTTNSGHGVIFTEPELIVDAVREMVAQIGAERP